MFPELRENPLVPDLVIDVLPLSLAGVTEAKGLPL